MNNPNFTYSGNYALAGITRILYNIWLEPICQDKDEFGSYKVNNVKKVGFQYKKNSDSNWNTIIIAESNSENGFYNEKAVYEKVYQIENLLENEVYCAETHGNPNYEVNGSRMLFPINIVIKNLISNTSYNVRSYYMDTSNAVHNYNSTTISTKKRIEGSETSLNLDFDDSIISYFSLDKNTYKESQKYQEIYNDYWIGIDVINSMVNFKEISDYDIGVKLFKSVGGKVGASAGKPTMTDYYSSNDNRMNTLIHETSHIVFPCEHLEITRERGLEHLSKIMKFMEFGSHIPQAIWKWQGGSHNYPCVNGAIHGKSYFEEHLVVYAWILLREEN